MRQLTPRMKRVALGGPDLRGFVSLAPEDHVKLFFPARGQEQPVLPSIGPRGTVILTGGESPSRDYTPRSYDPSAQLLEIDFFLHGDGPAAKWAESAGAGQWLGVAGPRGSYVLEQSFDWHLFVGDETALPEIALRLERMPRESRAYAVLLVGDANERQPLPTRAASLAVEWIERGSSREDASAALVDALRRLRLPASGGFSWVAGEASEARAALRHLTLERGFPRTCVRVSGHWKRGVANHDHHEEVLP